MNIEQAVWLLMPRDAKIKYLMNRYDLSRETVLKGFDLRTGQAKIYITTRLEAEG